MAASAVGGAAEGSAPQVAGSPRRVGGFVLPGGVQADDFTYEVPLKHDDPSDGRTLTIFYRTLTKHPSKKLPILCYLQGGPGFPSPRALGAHGWIGRALKEFTVLLMDQRGTGRSTPITTHWAQQVPDPQQQAEYLSCFRADSIVDDLEALRIALQRREPWALLGQSFGGFCTLTYLSKYPQSVTMAMFTGGIPPALHPIEDVYRATFRTVQRRNEQFFATFPEDKALVRRILRILLASPPLLPSGARLTAQRFQQLGILLGGSGGMQRLHYILEQAFSEGDDHLSLVFLCDVEAQMSFHTHPIYAILHEAIYMEGRSSRWAAQRVRDEPAFSAAFDASRVLAEDDAAESLPPLFSGEMVFPFMFDDEDTFVALKPLARAAHILAEKDDWPALYSMERLRECNVPCAAAIFYDDMYVEREFSVAVASQMPGMRTFITNEMQHSALRDVGYSLLDKLLSLTKGELTLPP